jgi:hypothetical protein
MAGLIDRAGPVNLRPRRPRPVESLVHAIIHQQLDAKAAGTIPGRLRALFSSDGFPAPEAVLKQSPERLRNAGLSRPKAGYILGIAQKSVDGHIPTLGECDRMTDAEIVERLTSIKGIGRWTERPQAMSSGCRHGPRLHAGRRSWLPGDAGCRSARIWKGRPRQRDVRPGGPATLDKRQGSRPQPCCGRYCSRCDRLLG